MSIQHLKISGVRNLASLALNLSPRMNLFFGNNGSGKTSFLEAVYLLAMARSFRTSKLAPVICHGLQTCTVFGRISTKKQVISIGVTRSLKEKQEIQMNGVRHRSVAELISVVPVQLMNSETFLMLNASPKMRRKLLNWGVFYFNEKFLICWKNMQFSLKQRNKLLREKKFQKEELNVWTNLFLQSALEVDVLRHQYLSVLFPKIEHYVSMLLGISDLQLSYYRGWPEAMHLEKALTHQLDKDVMFGYTSVGPQRSDLVVTYKKKPAVDVLSQGQQKMLMGAIKLAQGALYEEYHQTSCIYLIDDLLSELDKEHCALITNALINLKSQILMTAIDRDILCGLFMNTEKEMFHVEHGMIHAL